MDHKLLDSCFLSKFSKHVLHTQLSISTEISKSIGQLHLDVHMNSVWSHESFNRQQSLSHHLYIGTRIMYDNSTGTQNLTFLEIVGGQEYKQSCQFTPVTIYYTVTMY